MNKIICIGRQSGSNGHTIAKKTAEKLNVPCYDKELLNQAVQTSGMPQKLMESAEERAANPLMYSVWYEGGDVNYYGKNINDILYLTEKKLIQNFAAKQSCIFVGRCADDILKQAPNCSVLSVFITAPMEYRIKTMMEREKLDEKAAANRIRKIDKTRKNYYDFYTGNDWGKPSDYDVTLNVGSLGEDKVIAMLAEIFEKMNR